MRGKLVLLHDVLVVDLVLGKGQEGTETSEYEC